MVFAAPRRLPSAMRWMKVGTSIPVGHAVWHGASWQYRQRSASITACIGVNGGVSAAPKRSA